MSRRRRQSESQGPRGRRSVIGLLHESDFRREVSVIEVMDAGKGRREYVVEMRAVAPLPAVGALPGVREGTVLRRQVFPARGYMDVGLRSSGAAERARALARTWVAELPKLRAQDEAGGQRAFAPTAGTLLGAGITAAVASIPAGFGWALGGAWGSEIADQSIRASRFGPLGKLPSEASREASAARGQAGRRAPRGGCGYDAQAEATMNGCRNRSGQFAKCERSASARGARVMKAGTSVIVSPLVGRPYPAVVVTPEPGMFGYKIDRRKEVVVSTGNSLRAVPRGWVRVDAEMDKRLAAARGSRAWSPEREREDLRRLQAQGHLQQSFNPVDYHFEWTGTGPGGWYQWDYAAAHKAARAARDAAAKQFKAAGYTVRKWSLPNQLITRGGIGSGHPQIENVVTVYMLNADRGAGRRAADPWWKAWAAAHPAIKLLGVTPYGAKGYEIQAQGPEGAHAIWQSASASRADAEWTLARYKADEQLLHREYGVAVSKSARFGQRPIGGARGATPHGKVGRDYYYYGTKGEVTPAAARLERAAAASGYSMAVRYIPRQRMRGEYVGFITEASPRHPSVPVAQNLGQPIHAAPTERAFFDEINHYATRSRADR